MKLRLSNNSIRFRLSEEDLASLTLNGHIEVCVPMNQSKPVVFKYSLIITKASEFSTGYLNNHFRLFMPENLVAEWSHSDKVGFDAVIEMAGKIPVRILVEKDFHCFGPKHNKSEPNDLHNDPKTSP